MDSSVNVRKDKRNGRLWASDGLEGLEEELMCGKGVQVSHLP
jgi:hypothetical protein